MPKQKQSKVVIDLDAILDFIFDPEEKRSADTSLEETFLPSDENNPKSQISLVSRVKRETKNGEHTQHEAIRMNIITMLLNDLSDLEIENGEIIDEMTFGQEVAYNTLFNYGLLKEI